MCWATSFLVGLQNLTDIQHPLNFDKFITRNYLRTTNFCARRSANLSIIGR